LQQAHLVIISTVLMLLIIVPVIVLTLLFAWRYRQSNTEARYEPEWNHSIQLELFIWAAPLLIIIALGALTWITTHTLDPYRGLSRIEAGRPIPAGTRPLRIDVVALDWKWLFVYPEQGVATVNELALPVDQPVEFHITSESMMNSFYVPALAGQIYAMPGMETRLNAVLNQAGNFEGFSANYSGAGFSQMKFRTLGTDRAGFERWVAQLRSASAGVLLDREVYLELARPSIGDAPRHFGQAQAGLFDAVVNRCVQAGTPCIGDMMAAAHAGAEGGHAAMAHGHE
jgi:cytochrome o ubiquinol oxidase subunit 2